MRDPSWIDDLKAAMRDAGLTKQTQVARALDVRDATVSAWFHGKAAPDPDSRPALLQKIRAAGAYGAVTPQHPAGIPQPNPSNGASKGLAPLPAGDSRDGALWALAAMHETLAACYRAIAAGAPIAPSGGVPVAETLTAVEASLPPELREAPPGGRRQVG